jgi:hypothetical protein
VVVDHTGNALRRVKMTLTGPGLEREGISTSTDSDGVYELTELPAGRFTLAAQRSGYLHLRYGQRRPLEQGKPLELGEGQVLEKVKGIRHDNRDITSALLELKSGESLSDVEVIVTNRITTVTGQLADDRGRPLPNGTVVIFSDDAGQWGEMSAFVRTARPDQDGRYEVKGLPPRDYLAVALDYVQEGIWNDPEFLESLRQYAQRLTLIEGSSVALSLKLTKP